MRKAPETFFNADDFVPELRKLLAEPPFDPKKLLRVGIPVAKPEQGQAHLPAGTDRCEIGVMDGEHVWHWKVDSLQSLFRGDRQPPVLGAYPEAYNDAFIILDMHVLEISNFFGERRDLEMKDIYSALRRRPDGRSTGFVHDYMWQAAALVLGTRPLSQAEFEAIMARLERSCRTFEQGPSSRNYLAALKQTVGQGLGYGAE